MSDRYPPIADYALIGDCHAAALVSRSGSIDWCCLPRIDSGSCFGRILDWDRGGHCAIGPHGEIEDVARTYLAGTLVLATTFRTDGGQARLLDCFTMRRGGARRPARQLLRVIDGERGSLALDVVVAPRFDYGEVRPWLRRIGPEVWGAIGGDDGLVISGDAQLEEAEEHELRATVEVGEGDRLRLSMTSRPPAEIELEPPEPADAEELDERLEATVQWWRRWSSRTRFGGPEAEAVQRSALVLKALSHAPTGAIAAASTTSLPEAPGAGRNWDYRYSWIRDSVFAVRSLAQLGHDDEADGFRRFVERSAAGHAEELQIVFGVAGERRLTQEELPELEGYRGARPVRIGNSAARQLQLDAFGEVLNQAWRWFGRGHEPDDDYWGFLCDTVELAIDRWREPDHGLWEWPGEPRHFVHSKAMCWVAVDRGLRLADACGRHAPGDRWRAAEAEMRRTVAREGYDERRGSFLQAFGREELDAAALLLPAIEFVAYDDERMVSTVDVLREELLVDGLLRRYDGDDGLDGEEGAFVACTFWLAECLANQGRNEAAREAFDAARATANDLGLFAEEYDARGNEMLGNFPQGMSHLSHISAAIALSGPRSPR